jgi:hypothetical protein
MSKVDLTKLVDFTADIAFKNIMGRKEPMVAFSILVNAEGDSQMIEVAHGDGDYERACVYAGLHQMMRERGTIAYGYACEGWCAKVSQSDLLKKPVPRAKYHSDRIEVLIVLASDGFNSYHRGWKIRRDYKGAVAAFEEYDLSDCTPSGPLLDLLGGRA